MTSTALAVLLTIGEFDVSVEMAHTQAGGGGDNSGGGGGASASSGEVDGNPGNDMGVRNAGEAPNGQVGSWGGGSRGMSDGDRPSLKPQMMQKNDVAEEDDDTATEDETAEGSTASDPSEDVAEESFPEDGGNA